jgi:hypothetical protein
MTESEWLACADPNVMLAFLRTKATKRRLRLFAVGCCRKIWHRLTDARSRSAVEVAERFADDPHNQELRDALSKAAAAAYAVEAAARESIFMVNAHAAVRACHTVEYTVASEIFAAFAVMTACAAAYPENLMKSHLHCILLRDIFGNPFCPVSIDQSCKGGTALDLAQAIYDERAFDGLPILADALEDVGCTNQEILGHCRGSGPHVRGCWVLDLLLGEI